MLGLLFSLKNSEKSFEFIEKIFGGVLGLLAGSTPGSAARNAFASYNTKDHNDL